MRIARIEIPSGGRCWAVADGPEWAPLEGAPWEEVRPTGGRVRAVRLLAPVTPSKVVAVGANYAQHAAEMGKPVPRVPKIFLKAPSAVIGPEDPIRIPPETQRVDPEGELAVVIGRRIDWRTPREAVLGAVFGYTALDDVTCRDFQAADGVFARAKGFDSFCPVGPWIETDLDPSDLAVQTAVNGTVRAQGRTSEMVFDVPTLLAFVAAVMTLEPGDLLATGTPAGVAPIHAGDRVEVTLQGIGTLANPVVDREDRC